MLLTKEVEVRVNPLNVDYYKSLGYEIPMKKATEFTRKKHKKDYVYDFNSYILVKVDDLPKGSNVKIDVLCDYCKKNIITMSFKEYNNRTKITNKHACIDCARLKTNESILSLYNVQNASQSEEIKKRIAHTNIERYGVKVPSQNKDVLKKMKMTSLDRYGVENPMKSFEIRKKANESLCKNHTHKTSKQQLYLHNLYGGELNFAIKYYAVDICFPEEKIIIEYDGGGHDLRVTLKDLTQEEFNRKEIIRRSVLRKENYKQIHIISKKDLLPSDNTLLKMLSEAKQYFSDFPNHSWITYNIDTSTVHNAEHKEGVFFNFGELRRLGKIA